MYKLLLLLFLSFFSLQTSAEWVIGKEATLIKACKGKNMRFIAVNSTNTEMFSAICETGGEKTIWLLGLSSDQVQKQVNKVQGSLNQLVPYYVSKTARFAVVITPSSKYRSFWYWGLSTIEVNSKMRFRREGGITSLVPYVTADRKRVYALVGTERRSINTRVLTKISPEQITAKLSQISTGTPQYRIAVLYPGANRLFDLLLVESKGEGWWYFWGISKEDAREKATRNNACFTAAVPTGTTWAVTMIKCKKGERKQAVITAHKIESTTTKQSSKRAGTVKTNASSTTSAGQNAAGKAFAFSSSSSFSSNTGGKKNRE